MICPDCLTSIEIEQEQTGCIKCPRCGKTVSFQASAERKPVLGVTGFVLFAVYVILWEFSAIFLWNCLWNHRKFFPLHPVTIFQGIHLLMTTIFIAALVCVIFSFKKKEKSLFSYATLWGYAIFLLLNGVLTFLKSMTIAG